jgi:elongation factor G
MATGLQRLSEEDPTFVVSSDEETGQTIIAGMGELHLEIIKDRLFREFKVGAEAGRPQIAYRETVSANSEGEGKFVRQTGGSGQYGHARIKLEPLERGAGIEIVDKTVGGVIPKEFIQPTLEGIREAANNGAVCGYPVVDFKVTLFDGSFHDVDSSEMSFKMAGIFAFRDAMEKASPQLLEPMMKVEVETPDEYQGDIMGDLNRRRGQIQNVSSKTAFVSIAAMVPLQEMFGYATIVRSLSKGRASYSMEPESFEPVPQNVLNTILETSTRGRY